MIDFFVLSLPIFAVMGVGWAATRTRLVAQGALDALNAFSFQFALPALVLRLIVGQPLRQAFNPEFYTGYVPRAKGRDYLGRRAARRVAGTPLRCRVTGFVVSAASSNRRNPCSNSSTAFPKAPSCPARTIATLGRRSNAAGRNTFTVSIERFLAIKRAGSSPTP